MDDDQIKFISKLAIYQILHRTFANPCTIIRCETKDAVGVLCP